MSDCPRLGKWFGGCRFEARYDLTPAKSLQDIFGNCEQATFNGSVQGVLEKTRAKTYVRDVCTVCGKTIERATP
jgi:hypothetical protein